MEKKMGCFVTKVEKVYQEVRAICRNNSDCNSLDMAMIKHDFGDGTDWKLSAKENRALKRKCDWLGV